jgi:hypothetical protein
LKVIHLVFVFEVLLFLAWLGLASCVAVAPAAPPEAPTAASTDATADTMTTTITSSTTAPALTEAALANASYPSEYTESGVVQLEDGEYRVPVAPGSATELVVTLDEVAFGDLNEDGVEDAAVILVTEPGGSGTFYDLAAVLNQNGEAVSVDSTLLGDRIQLEALAIEAGDIQVEMVTHGSSDPLCCPTQEVTQTYQLQDDQLVLIATSEPE